MAQSSLSVIFRFAGPTIKLRDAFLIKRALARKCVGFRWVWGMI